MIAITNNKLENVTYPWIVKILSEGGREGGREVDRYCTQHCTALQRFRFVCREE